MSHWTQGTTIIKDLELLKRVAEKMGVNTKQDARLEGAWAGDAGIVPLALEKDGGTAGVVKSGTADEYFIKMDNYHNPICDTIGQSGSLLTRNYVVEKTREEAVLMGGTILDESVSADGYVEMLINVG